MGTFGRNFLLEGGRALLVYIQTVVVDARPCTLLSVPLMGVPYGCLPYMVHAVTLPEGSVIGRPYPFPCPTRSVFMICRPVHLLSRAMLQACPSGNPVPAPQSFFAHSPDPPHCP